MGAGSDVEEVGLMGNDWSSAAARDGRRIAFPFDRFRTTTKGEGIAAVAAVV